MSGDPAPLVELVARPGEDLAGLGRVLAMLGANAEGSPFALIGGLAVMARLGERHRATNDIDTVFAESGRGGDLRAILVAAGGRAMPDAVDVGDVKVETIPVYPLTENTLSDDLLERSFLLAHRWALDTATPVRLVVRAGEPEGDVEAAVPTATVPALIAMKLHSFPTRRARNRSEKRAADLHDLYRLLIASDVPSLRHAFSASPFDLANVCLSLVRRMLEERAGDTVSAIRLAGPGLAGVTFDDFASAADTLLSAVG